MNSIPTYLPGLPPLADVQAQLDEARKHLAAERAEESAIQRAAARVYRGGEDQPIPEFLIEALTKKRGGIPLATRRERIAALSDIVAGFEQLEVLATIRDLSEGVEQAIKSEDHGKAARIRAQIAVLRKSNRELIAVAESEGIAP